MKPPDPGAAVQQSVSRMWRSGDGKLRCDSPESSVIIDLPSQQTIVLDHLKKEASVFRMPQLPGGQFGVPGGLPDGGLMKARLVNVEDLGKSMIDGQEVFGKRYTFQPPGAPTMPSMPQAPALPNMPKPPELPKLPKTQYTVSEIWTSTKLQLPVYSKTTGSFGEQIRRCRYAEAGEPNPAVFQIPAGYKPPVPPALPNMPGAPAVPQGPTMPNVPAGATPPTLPNAPSAPTLPGVPAPPAVPQAPTLPGVPKIPGISG